MRTPDRQKIPPLALIGQVVLTYREDRHPRCNPVKIKDVILDYNPSGRAEGFSFIGNYLTTNFFYPSKRSLAKEVTLKDSAIRGIEGFYSTFQNLECYSKYNFSGPFGLVRIIDQYKAQVRLLKDSKIELIDTIDIGKWFSFEFLSKQEIKDQKMLAYNRGQCDICYRPLYKLRASWFCEEHYYRFGC